MITKKEASVIAVEYLKNRNREYFSMRGEDAVSFNSAEELLYGNRKGELVDTYSISYTVEWGLDLASEFITMDAHTGEILYSMSSTRWIEAYE
jgi:hypothetical protein